MQDSEKIIFESHIIDNLTANCQLRIIEISKKQDNYVRSKPSKWTLLLSIVQKIETRKEFEGTHYKTKFV